MRGIFCLDEMCGRLLFLLSSAELRTRNAESSWVSTPPDVRMHAEEKAA